MAATNNNTAHSPNFEQIDKDFDRLLFLACNHVENNNNNLTLHSITTRINSDQHPDHGHHDHVHHHQQYPADSRHLITTRTRTTLARDGGGVLGFPFVDKASNMYNNNNNTEQTRNFN